MDVIAERKFELHTESGPLDVVVALARPVRDSDPRGDWVCTYEIVIGDKSTSMTVHGIDSMQALQLAIGTLDVELTHRAKQMNGELRYLEEPFVSLLDGGNLQRKTR